MQFGRVDLGALQKAQQEYDTIITALNNVMSQITQAEETIKRGFEGQESTALFQSSQKLITQITEQQQNIKKTIEALKQNEEWYRSTLGVLE